MGYPPMLRAPRYNSLDLWRGVACLSVIALHSMYYATDAHPFSAASPASWILELTKWGWVGVPIFFVISGYCISASADSSRRKGHSIARYATRRFRRIFPPYWICVAIFVVLVAAVELCWPGMFEDDNHPIHAPWSFSLDNVFGELTLTEMWREHVFGGPRKRFLTHNWTLNYEEQFYLATGLLLVLSGRFFFVSAAVVTILVFRFGSRAPIGFFFDGAWLQFAAGILVYYATVYGGKWWSLGAGMLLSLLAAWSLKYGGGALLVACLFAITILALRPFDDAICRQKWATPLIFAGLMCYSLYLVHWPICKFVSHSLWLGGVRSEWASVAVTLPLCFAASIAAGWAFHLGVERRFLNTPITRSATD